MSVDSPQFSRNPLAQQIVDSVQEGIIVLDSELRYVVWNPFMERFTGIKSKDVIGRTPLQLFPFLKDQGIMALFERALQGHVSTGPDVSSPALDGSVLWSMGKIGPLLNEHGEVNGVLVCIIDITERKRSEEEHRKLEAQIQHSQRLESLGVLAGGIAHDFNNLLVGILGNSDLALLEVGPNSAAYSRVGDIKVAGIRASELTKQMLAYAGKGKFVVETLALNDIIREMGHLIQSSVSKKAVLKYDLSYETPLIDADAAQIRQVIMNLIINASEALGDNTGTVTISTGIVNADAQYLSDIFLQEGLHAGRYTYLEVSDTGCGMDKETTKKIFDPFFSTKFTGRGLGLAAVMGIVRAHKGAIKVYSEPSRGTSFKLLFPCSAQTVMPNSTPGTHGDTWRGEGTILVIEDEEILRNVIQHSLTRFGFEVLTAVDGKDGVDTFQQHSAGIRGVILDMTMPRMSGEETFRELRRIKPDVRVLLTSGYNEQDATNRFAGKGLAGFIQKPFQVASLIAKIRDMLEKSSPATGV